MRRTPLRASLWRRIKFPLMVFLAGGPALADPGPVTSRLPVGSLEVTWADIVRLVEEHPRLAAGKFQIQAARGAIRAARAVPNPTLEGTVGQGLARNGPESRFEWSLALNVPLSWIAQRGARVAAAEAEVDVAVSERKALRRDVLVQLSTLFWSLAYEQARVGSLESLDAETAELGQAVKRRVEKGEVRPVDSIRVEIELEKVKSELEAARISLAARRDELGVWLRAPKGERIVAQVGPDALPETVSRDDALAKARASHPALEAVRARTRTLAAEVEVEKRARVPALSAKGFAGFEFDRRTFGIGLAVDLPLWNWNSGRIAQAEARLAAGRMQAEATARELETTVIEAEAACRASAATATRFRQNLIPRSEASAKTMERTYQLGEASLLELIDARRTLLEARRLHLNALSHAQIDCSRLGALVGKDSR
jgi:outer membrane protein, heavy metal efflux system